MLFPKLLGLLLPAAGLLAAFTLARPTTAPTTANAARVPVVVELFTSEGCSSCPSADAALRALETAQSVPGAEVIALGEHVDYWNRLGWKDGFSSAAYTERQRQYAAHFGSGSYTPQAVVNGQYEFVGSQKNELARTVAQAAEAPRAGVAVSAAGDKVSVKVTSVPAGTQAAEVVLLITESGLSSQVGRGENSGRLLRHASVVRTLQPLGRVAADGTFVGTATPELAKDWNRTNLRAVVLVQETASRRIVGASSAGL